MHRQMGQKDQEVEKLQIQLQQYEKKMVLIKQQAN